MHIIYLAPTSSSHPVEDAAPGGGRNGVGGGVGAAPLRYGFTGKGRNTLSPWVNSSYTYSLLQLNLGSNPISKLEVASSLNLFNQARNMYHYNYQNCTSRYYPKVYIGTAQTIAIQWNYDSQNTSKPPANQWPNSYQSNTQKGEANTEGL